jgi:hypothetical protein
MDIFKCIFCDSILDIGDYYYNYYYRCNNCSTSKLNVIFNIRDGSLLSVRFYGENYSAQILYKIKEVYIEDYKECKFFYIRRLLGLKPHNFDKQIELIKLMC